ncbi:MAG TPA: ABC-F family ATP-binding cassette domain-containing protein, partial [Candidatus Sulfotelmatobacter sp.]|nr:ABC-F family ATP-binding cassette domain-containing protein [Candidatus Sulfotelmatobacter sp.]
RLAPIISARDLAKRFGVSPLFRSISFTVSEGERIGIIGPNGSGKSTLLAILQGRVTPDSGDVAIRKGTRLNSVLQMSDFAEGETVRAIVARALDNANVAESDRAARMAEILGRAGFADLLEADASRLSGGWRKRLAIVEALVQAPDILLLDEPTNHLDLAGIQWLEGVLQNGAFACVVVSHDRYFLENVANEVVELNPAYEDGALRVSGNYSTFLEKKEEYLHAQRNRQEALENRVHTEIDWLRRGPKARTTKSKARIDKAHEMIRDLAEMNARTKSVNAAIDFAASARKTKQLITLDGVSYGFGERMLFDNLHFIVTSGMRVGLVGPNGSGKTTLLRLLRGDVKTNDGVMRQAENLRIVYFDQNRELDPEVTLRRALAPDSDSVIYQERVIHVGGWAARFLFTAEQLNQKVGRLSGGERARVLIAQLMLQPADVLLLDEPTNDLDIPTLEILEESLLEYTGALVLVTHDRYMLDRVSTVVLGLDGAGGAERFADYSQWEEWSRERKAATRKQESAVAKSAGEGGEGSGPTTAASAARLATAKKKLSYKENRELETIEQRVAEAEAELQSKHDALLDPAIMSDGARLHQVSLELEAAQKRIDELYSRWVELEDKLK